MTGLPRRTVLFRGVGVVAAAAVGSVVAGPGSASAAVAADGERVVRWDAQSRRWGARPVGAGVVVFSSAHDASAPAPRVAGLVPGDVWRRHPDADAHTSGSSQVSVLGVVQGVSGVSGVAA